MYGILTKAFYDLLREIKFRKGKFKYAYTKVFLLHMNILQYMPKSTFSNNRWLAKAVIQKTDGSMFIYYNFFIWCRNNEGENPPPDNEGAEQE